MITSSKNQIGPNINIVRITHAAVMASTEIRRAATL